MLRAAHIITLFSLSYYTCSSSLLKDTSHVILVPDVEYDCCSKEILSPIVYCYLGIQRSLLNNWLSAKVYIHASSDKYDVYEGRDDWEVRNQYESHHSAWNFNIFNWHQEYFKLNPFNATCIGIVTVEDCILTLRLEWFDKQLIGMFLAGVLLFFISPALINEPLFYYISGTIVGVLASVLILLYIILKLLPLKKPAVFGIMAGGSTIILYFFHAIFNSFVLLALSYSNFVICYFIASALISFIVCYRFGPMSNPRSKNLVRWSLQTISLALIFFSSHTYKVTMVTTCIILILHQIPLLKFLMKTFKRRKSEIRLKKEQSLMNYGVEQRYLSEREYQLQGRIETKRGLQELRMFFVNSPSNFRWEIVRRLRNPYKFSEFLQGESHISSEELKNTEGEALITDDSESE